jgi:L-asparaginase II
VAAPDAFVPVAVTSRSGRDESVHFGAMVGLSATGEVEFAVGDPAVVIYPRSSNKPMQAVAMVRAGLELPPELLAVVCASHDGTSQHLDAVRRILDDAGLDEHSLANTADLPLDQVAAETVLRHGGGRTALQMNCSGKHSGMLATSAANGWPVDPTYLSPDHPVQQRITETIEELTVEPHAHIGVDGCGAPAHMMSLLGLARAFRAIATGAAGRAGDAVYHCMTAHPEMVGGARRDVTRLMASVPGLVAKDGAEGVFVASLADGRTVSLKIADGASRVRPAVMLAGLRVLGVDTSSAEPLVRQRVLGHGLPVGEVRAIAP